MRRSALTEEKIIRAALALFVRIGYHATSIQNITDSVNLTKGALYSHFKSKSDLLLRIIEEYRTRWLDKLVGIVEDYQGNPVEKLHKIISLNARFALENEDLCVFLGFMTSELKLDTRFEESLKNIYSEYQQFISRLIRQGKKEGHFKKNLDPNLTALFFIGSHDGMLHQWILNRDRLDGMKYTRTCRDILIGGLLK